MKFCKKMPEEWQREPIILDDGSEVIDFITCFNCDCGMAYGSLVTELPQLKDVE